VHEEKEDGPVASSLIATSFSLSALAAKALVGLVARQASYRRRVVRRTQRQVLDIGSLPDSPPPLPRARFDAQERVAQSLCSFLLSCTLSYSSLEALPTNEEKDRGRAADDRELRTQRTTTTRARARRSR